MIIKLNDDYFIVIDEEYKEIVKDTGEDWIKVAEWVELNGVIIPADHFIMTVGEVLSFVDELSHKYISYDNEVCRATIERMMRFVERVKEDAGKSKDH